MSEVAGTLSADQAWFPPGVAGIGGASLLGGDEGNGCGSPVRVGLLEELEQMQRSGG